MADKKEETSTGSSLYGDLKSGLGTLLTTGVDVYKATLDSKNQQAATKAAAQAELNKSDDIITVGGVEISVTKLLLSSLGVIGLVWLVKNVK